MSIVIVCPWFYFHLCGQIIEVKKYFKSVKLNYVT